MKEIKMLKIKIAFCLLLLYTSPINRTVVSTRRLRESNWFLFHFFSKLVTFTIIVVKSIIWAFYCYHLYLQKVFVLLGSNEAKFFKPESVVYTYNKELNIFNSLLICRSCFPWKRCTYILANRRVYVSNDNSIFLTHAFSTIKWYRSCSQFLFW